MELLGDHHGSHLSTLAPWLDAAGSGDWEKSNLEGGYVFVSIRAGLFNAYRWETTNEMN
jgi:hypothetical protein